MKENKPLVSIFLPYYNDKEYIEDCINSVINQTYDNWELFLFNHASTDGSRSIAHQYNDSRIIHIDAKENLGAGSGYNLKITLPQMKGEYLKLLCADDMLKENYLQKMVYEMESDSKLDVAFCDMEYVNEKKELIDTSWLKEHEDTLKDYSNEYILKEILMRASPLPFPANFIRKAALKEVKLDTTSIMLFDISLWTQLLIRNKKFKFLEEQLVVYRINNSQVSSASGFIKSLQQSFFETSYVYDLFYELKDVELAKKLFAEIEYTKMLSDNDVEFLPFIVAYYYLYAIKEPTLFYSCHTAVQINGYKKLCEIMANELLARKIKEKFGFGIKEFRAIYSYMPKETKKTFKQHILNKTARDLSIVQLVYLLVRRFEHCISPFHWIKKIKRKIKTKNKKTYTV